MKVCLYYLVLGHLKDSSSLVPMASSCEQCFSFILFLTSPLSSLRVKLKRNIFALSHTEHCKFALSNPTDSWLVLLKLDSVKNALWNEVNFITAPSKFALLSWELLNLHLVMIVYEKSASFKLQLVKSILVITLGFWSVPEKFALVDASR